MSIVVKPAYGRTYESRYFIEADWKANKDFFIAGGGPYINRSDWVKYGKMEEDVIFSYRNIYLQLEKGIGEFV